MLVVVNGVELRFLEHLRKELIQAIQSFGEVVVFAGVPQCRTLYSDFLNSDVIDNGCYSGKPSTMLFIRWLQFVWSRPRCLVGKKVDRVLSFGIFPSLIFLPYALSMSRSLRICALTGIGQTERLPTLVQKVIFGILGFGYSKLVVQNRVDLNYLRHLMPSLHDRLVLIPGSGVSANRIRESYSDKIGGSTSDSVVVAFLGRLVISKGVLDFLQMAQNFLLLYPQHKHVIFRLCGVEYQRNDMLTISELRCRLSERDKQQIEICDASFSGLDIIADCDIFVCCSYREGLSVSCMEAMSLSKPIVGYNVAGVSDLVTGDNGFLVEKGDSKSLGERVAALVELPEEKRGLMGHFSYEHFVKSGLDSTSVINRYLESLALVS